MSACSQRPAPQAREDDRARKRVRVRSPSALAALVPMSLHSGQRTYASVEQTKLSTGQRRAAETHGTPRSRLSHGGAPSRALRLSAPPRDSRRDSATASGCAAFICARCRGLALFRTRCSS
eukprot:CAMPEP_0113235116 /NCGR_PEP_ID=MMETSP0008_2-20120614/3386_1 /TAXON_ID=97485 /ORGANISM="Prymnesium parvum" /LENGTH=120 /DNA_ID=CAMNT_0000082025 /DNA_START=237 /DNA_END=596 /DNA_ORIENTATION=- /assembly_acc=CAM_ASM_000153